MLGSKLGVNVRNVGSLGPMKVDGATTGSCRHSTNGFTNIADGNHGQEEGLWNQNCSNFTGNPDIQDGVCKQAPPFNVGSKTRRKSRSEEQVGSHSTPISDQVIHECRYGSSSFSPDSNSLEYSLCCQHGSKLSGQILYPTPQRVSKVSWRRPCWISRGQKGGSNC